MVECNYTTNFSLTTCNHFLVAIENLNALTEKQPKKANDSGSQNSGNGYDDIDEHTLQNHTNDSRNLDQLETTKTVTISGDNDDTLCNRNNVRTQSYPLIVHYLLPTTILLWTKENQ